MALPSSELGWRLLETLKVTHQFCHKSLSNQRSNLPTLLVFRVSQCTPVTWRDFVPNGIKGCEDTSIQQGCSMCHGPKAHPEQVLHQIKDTWGQKGLDLPLLQTLFDIFHMCKILCIKCCFSGYLTLHMSVMLSLADKMTRECPSKPKHWKWEI